MKKLFQLQTLASRLVPGLQVDLAGFARRAQAVGLEAALVSASADLLAVSIKSAHARARARRKS